MRLIFSVVGLLVVALCVMLLARSQLQAVQPTPTPASAPTLGLDSSQRAPDDSVPSNPVSMPRQVQQDVTRSLEQGMAARASAVAQ